MVNLIKSFFKIGEHDIYLTILIEGIHNVWHESKGAENSGFTRMEAVLFVIKYVVKASFDT